MNAFDFKWPTRRHSEKIAIMNAYTVLAGLIKHLLTLDAIPAAAAGSLLDAMTALQNADKQMIADQAAEDAKRN
jgi:hypothetical protein